MLLKFGMGFRGWVVPGCEVSGSGKVQPLVFSSVATFCNESLFLLLDFAS